MNVHTSPTSRSSTRKFHSTFVKIFSLCSKNSQFPPHMDTHESNFFDLTSFFDTRTKPVVATNVELITTHDGFHLRAGESYARFTIAGPESLSHSLSLSLSLSLSSPVVSRIMRVDCYGSRGQVCEIHLDYRSSR